MSKSAILMLGLVLFGVIGGPVIFYGLLSLGEAGVFDNALDNFWLLAGIGFGLIALFWVAVLYIGHAATKGDQKEGHTHG